MLLLCLGIQLLSLSGLFAQDPHFSQYFSSPMTLNPALTGKGVDDWRLCANLRSQWWGGSIKPYYTFTGALEKTFNTGADNPNYGAVGFMALSDQSNGGLLKNNYYSVAAAYHVSLDAAGSQQLSAGLSGTYANRILDAGRFKFQSQLGSMGFQRDLPANDPVSILKSDYFDFNAGLYYSVHTATYGFQAGAALFHASSPQEGSYENSNYHIPRRYSFQAGGWMKSGIDNSIHLSAIAESQAGNTIYTLGGVYKLAISDNLLRSVNLGVWERFGDAIYPYFGLETDRWLGALTYDIVHGGVAGYQSVQSLEFSFSLKMGRKQARAGVYPGLLAY